MAWTVFASAFRVEACEVRIPCRHFSVASFLSCLNNSEFVAVRGDAMLPAPAAVQIAATDDTWFRHVSLQLHLDIYIYIYIYEQADLSGNMKIRVGAIASYPLQMSSIWSSFYWSTSAWIREGAAAYWRNTIRNRLQNIAQKWEVILYKNHVNHENP